MYTPLNPFEKKREKEFNQYGYDVIMIIAFALTMIIIAKITVAVI